MKTPISTTLTLMVSLLILHSCTQHALLVKQNISIETPMLIKEHVMLLDHYSRWMYRLVTDTMYNKPFPPIIEGKSPDPEPYMGYLVIKDGESLKIRICIQNSFGQERYDYLKSQNVIMGILMWLDATGRVIDVEFRNNNELVTDTEMLTVMNCLKSTRFKLDERYHFSYNLFELSFRFLPYTKVIKGKMTVIKIMEVTDGKKTAPELRSYLKISKIPTLSVSVYPVELFFE